MKTFAQEIDDARAAESAALALVAEAESARDALKAELDKCREDRAADTAATAEIITAMQKDAAALMDQINTLTGALDAANARAEAAENRLAMVPALADVTAGAKPVADGLAAGDGATTDWVRECERRHGAERMAFYRANRAAIDAAYANTK